MQRLTKRNSHGCVLVNYKNIKRIDCIENADIIVALASKLSKYEEIGTIEEFKNIKEKL